MPDSPVLGYITVNADGDGFRGAALVVDHRGIPLDFRYTDTVSPTRLERVLYGDALEIYVREEVILGSLLDAVEESPNIWICGDRHLLEPVSNRAKCLAVTLEGANRNALEEPGSLSPMPEEGYYLLQVSLMGPPCRLSVLSEPDSAKAASMLVTAGATMDVLEPFSRIDRAIESLE
nr:hypothetical protein [uncultured Dethiosulfovibrio sp.]